MAAKKAPKATEEVIAPEEVVQVPIPCGAWAFILGPSLGAFCRMETKHEGEHQTEIQVHAEPRSHFTITWALEE